MRRICSMEIFSRIILVLFYAAAGAWVLLRHSPVDYPPYAMAAWGFQRGENVYRWGETDYARAAATLGFEHYAPPYRYPPLTALLVLPLLTLPDRGMGLWIFLQALCALLTAEALARLFGEPGRPWQRTLIRMSVGLFPPFLVSLYAGQVNPLVVLLATLTLQTIRRGQEGRGGFLLGLSLMLKPLAVGVAGLLLWEGRWRALRGMALGIAIALGMSALAFGPPALEFLRAPMASAGGAYPPAQNLPSMAIRWLTRHPYGSALIDAPIAAQWMGGALAGAIVLLTLAGLGRPGTPREPLEDRAAWATAAAFLANPGTWYHHGVMLSLALGVLLRRAGRRPPLWNAALAISVGAVALWGLAWHAFVGWTFMLDLGTLGALGLWILLAREIGRRRAL
ncbi:hypothetical protein HRbin22_02307 [Candidatus Thermoflexus japonica]|uniref:DUF2029 domain-containing protein n=1 Tax=Candidatus Thermoflexus japonica TaxID=2035417 RepID=A0A2H5Y9B7_9CHLR|nr:hypothetical protein HRbin22_02307 [Candidatus Thermoflexus japonica]